MGAFDKFNNFKVNTEDRISEEDKRQLERFQEIYDGTLLYYKRVYALYMEEQAKYTKQDEEYVSGYSNLRASSLKVFDTVKALQQSFPQTIYSYFSRKYNVDLDNRMDSDKFVSMRLYQPSEEQIKELFEQRNYKPFLEDIIGQLGGMSFGDVAVQQIKNKMKEACIYGRNGDKWRIEIKNATIKYEGWTSIDDWMSRCDYRVNKNEFLNILPSVLGLFAFNDERMGFSRIRGYDIELSEEEMKSGLKFSEGCKLSVLKFFKNGNISLKFEKPEYAREFARDWCGYQIA